MSREDHKEQMRCQVERLLATDMGVAEWCARNKVSRQTMYYWLSYFAENEPELFGDKQNIVSRDKRRWLESTRKNMAASKALANVRPAEIVIVNSGIPAQAAHPTKPYEMSAPSQGCILVGIKGVEVSIPEGSSRIDIENVLGTVASL